MQDEKYRYRLKWILVCLHAGWLVVLTVFFQYINLVRLDEFAFYRLFSVIRDDLFHKDNKPLAGDFVFLDVSRDLELAQDTSRTAYDSSGGLPGSQIVLTNRLKLARFFSQLAQERINYRYLICDLSFDIPSVNDTILRPVIEKTPRLLVAASSVGEIPEPPLFKVAYAGVIYQASEGNFVKLPIFYNDSIKSLPAVMAETTGQKRYTRYGPITLENGHPAFNTFVPELYFRPDDLVLEGSKANCWNLGEIIRLPTFARTLRDKYIVIGNFATDRHTTYLGSIPGPLIIVNAFLTLREKSLIPAGQWLLLLFVVYGALSYLLFFRPEWEWKKVQEKIKVKFMVGVIKKYLSYAGLLLLLDLVSYLFFRNFISLFYIVTYLTALSTILEKVREYRGKKNLWVFIKEELL